MSPTRWSETFTNADVYHIVSNMRAVDRFEAASFGSEPGGNVAAYIAASHLSMVFYFRDRPAFIAGAIETVPGVFAIWGFGTDDTRRVMPTMTKVCRDYIAKELFVKHCARRLFVQLPHHPMCRPNIQWLRSLGFKAESVATYATIDDGAVLTMRATKADYQTYVSSLRAESAKTSSDSTVNPSSGTREDRRRRAEEYGS